MAKFGPQAAQWLLAGAVGAEAERPFFQQSVSDNFEAVTLDVVSVDVESAWPATVTRTRGGMNE